MDEARRELLKYVAPLAAVVVFVVLVAIVGTTYGGADLTGSGAYALVAVMIVFILGMAVAGILLGTRD